MMTDGPAVKRPPHRVLAGAVRRSRESLKDGPSIRKITTRRAFFAWTLAAALAARKPTAATAQALPKLKVLAHPAALPSFAFTDAAGHSRTLKDYAGKGIVLNFWATWCPPCAAELPSLDQLAARLADHNVVVLPLSSDHGGVSAVRNFYRQHGITHLPILIDPQGNAVRTVDLAGIPATLIIGSDGLERAYVEGREDWSTTAAIGRLEQLVGAGQR
jgi:thiol-disulfide isomerase/thioredoxin